MTKRTIVEATAESLDNNADFEGIAESQDDTPEFLGAPAPAAPKLHPLFPGRRFISTVLEVLESKQEMTGRLVGKYLQRAAMAGFFVGIFFTTYFAIIARFSAFDAGAGFALVGKVLAALTFGWALVLIYYTNSELLTSEYDDRLHRRLSQTHHMGAVFEDSGVVFGRQSFGRSRYRTVAAGLKCGGWGYSRADGRHGIRQNRLLDARNRRHHRSFRSCDSV